MIGPISMPSIANTVEQRKAMVHLKLLAAKETIVHQFVESLVFQHSVALS